MLQFALTAASTLGTMMSLNVTTLEELTEKLDQKGIL